ncbi:MAG: glycosyltransferase family 4 protein [Anaerolineae bacterium]|nr:glycosyltransferase family 4 protein [Anaerolineae bacterium]
MRIGYDGTPLLGTRSGVGSYTRHLLAHIADLHPEWNFLLYSNRPMNGDNSLPEATLVPGYFSYSRWLWMQFKLPRLIQHSQPDLCHFTNNTAPLHHVTPYLITIHDVSLFLYSQYHPRSRLLALRWLLPVVARRAAHVLTVSEFARRDIIRILKLPPEKVSVVYEAAAPHFHPHTDSACLKQLRDRYQLPETFVLYVGTIEPRKNLTRLVQAMSRVWRHYPGCPLVLVGPNGWLMNGVLEQTVAQMEAADKVRLLGYVPEEDLPGLYTLATLFVFPSLYEGFGLPPLEAMACGTPVLTSHGSAMAEICGEAAYLVDPTSEKAIAEGILGLLADAGQRRGLGERGLVQARQYSWQRAAQETVTLYERVLARGK